MDYRIEAFAPSVQQHIVREGPLYVNGLRFEQLGGRFLSEPCDQAGARPFYGPHNAGFRLVRAEDPFEHVSDLGSEKGDLMSELAPALEAGALAILERTTGAGAGLTPAEATIAAARDFDVSFGSVGDTSNGSTREPVVSNPGLEIDASAELEPQLDPDGDTTSQPATVTGELGPGVQAITAELAAATPPATFTADELNDLTAEALRERMLARGLPFTQRTSKSALVLALLADQADLPTQ